MKVKLYGIWEIRQQRFMSENGIVSFYETVKLAKADLEICGKYHADGGVLLRVMPIHLTPYDNKQIFEALDIKG